MKKVVWSFSGSTRYFKSTHLKLAPDSHAQQLECIVYSQLQHQSTTSIQLTDAIRHMPDVIGR